MKVSEAWLREFVNPPITLDQLVAQLTMAGLEVDSVTPAVASFTHVVVGEVSAIAQHPDADRLHVCQVNIGQDALLQIVCGARNVRQGLKIPVALCDAVLPGDFKIKKSTLRGVDSYGMLCSEKELGLASESQGLMELPDDAPLGLSIRDYLALDDTILEIDLTPNRADCLSVEGLAREIAVLNEIDWSPALIPSVAVQHQDILSVRIDDSAACPRYLGRLIKNVAITALTPRWLKERLRRSGLRSVNPIVDVTNYVLLEMGQPMHAFDAAKLQGGIVVRRANDESITLLNQQTLTLDAQTLVIADGHTPIALAGIMGGMDASVTDATSDIMLECAFFMPESIAGKARNYGLHTDSSHRFERGVDYTLQARAMERATQLIVEIAGGEVGVVFEATAHAQLPKRQPIILRKQRIEKILGTVISDEVIENILKRLSMLVERQDNAWQITAPGCRFDIAIEADLIEEIARIYGYNQLPSNYPLVQAKLQSVTEKEISVNRFADLLVDKGYQEAITYSFVDEDSQKIIAPNEAFIRLKNPISLEMSVMRTTLWCGLIKAAQHNVNRQQTRVRLFESGLCFTKHNDALHQEPALAGLVMGSVTPEQWGEKIRSIDFYDVKADIESIFALTGTNVLFKQSQHPALHPGQTAEIYTQDGVLLGFFGMLHPTHEKHFGFESVVFLFEFKLNQLKIKQQSVFTPLSKFPSVRRDLALLIKNDVSAQEVIECIKLIEASNLKEVKIFDIYQGKGIEEGFKSIALSLHLQNDAQTLTDLVVDDTVKSVLATLTYKISAKLRD